MEIDGGWWAIEFVCTPLKIELLCDSRKLDIRDYAIDLRCGNHLWA